VTAQLRVSTDLPHIIPIGRLLTCEIQIEKANASGFAKLEIRNTQLLQMQMIDSHAGIAETSDSLLLVRWEVLPNDSILTLRLKIMPVQIQENVNVVFSFQYNADDVPRMYQSQPYRVVFTDNVLPLVQTPRMELLHSIEEPAIPIPPINIEQVLKKSPAEIDQQVAQLKKDALRAFTVGELEKGRVSIKLDTLNKKIQLLGDTAGNNSKKSELAVLLERKKELQDELVIAERVLTLARTLNAQADEIQRISKEYIASAQKPKAESNKTKTNLDPLPPKPSEPVAKKETERAIPMIGQISDKGLVFKVQLGAFKEQPDLSVFKRAGKVVIINDNGIFKALHGSYSSKQDASNRRSELLEIFPDCFVVAYQDGMRLK
jgi:hypothetical protein